MTDQKHEDTATTKGMPEVVVEGPVTQAANPIIPAAGHSNTAVEVELQALKSHLHDMEEAVHNFLTHNAGTGHPQVAAWLVKVKARLFPAPKPSIASTPPAPEATAEPSEPSSGGTESSTSSTSNTSDKAR